MLIVERQSRLLELVRQKQIAELAELCDELSVSASTVRRDLEALEDRGLVRRTHGGAIFTGNTEPRASVVNALKSRMLENISAKQAIGLHAAELVQPHMTVLMDAGSTVVYTAQAITVRPIQVVTNSLTIANHFAEDDQVELIQVGGNLYPRTGAMVGPLARQSLNELHADICFFSLAGIDEHAAYNINIEMARVEQMMMQRANQSVMLMDSTKFGRKSLVKVCDLHAADRIITDAAIDPVWQKLIGERLTVTDTP